MTGLLLRARRDERGFSIVELASVMVIFAIVGGILLSSVISAERTLRNTNALAAEITQARESLVEMSRVLRTSRRGVPSDPPFVTATSTELTFYANFRTEAEPGPKLIRIVLEGEDLVEYIQPAIADAGDLGWTHDDVMDGRRRVLATPVTNTDIFTYVSRDQDVIADPTAAGSEPPGRVDITLEIGGPPIRETPTVMQQTVRTPNFNQF